MKECRKGKTRKKKKRSDIYQKKCVHVLKYSDWAKEQYLMAQIKCIK